MKFTCDSQRAFTRTDLLVIICLVTLFLAITLTGHADNRGRSQKLSCMDNLRQIGEGFNAWRFEHGDDQPWNVSPTNGGTYGFSVGLPWIEFTFLSNTVASPRILVCPSDTKVLPRTASNWGNGPGGFQNSGYRNNSLSYTLGLHAFLEAPSELLSSDRDLSVDGLGNTCAYAGLGANIAAGINSYSPATRVGWTNEIHRSLGNILTGDGTVLEKNTSQLRTFLRIGQNDNGVIHILVP
ncbi:MAG: hypothetical protein JWM16_3973 [Verrucomicrobiales bacterium]|nr:hypothetical protein [Verrucomicrobiales bacterium]